MTQLTLQDRDRRRANGEWVEYSEEEYEEEEIIDISKAELVPYSEEDGKGPSNPFHCPFCLVWLPSVPLLKFTHRYTSHLVFFCKKWDHFQPLFQLPTPTLVKMFVYTLCISFTVSQLCFIKVVVLSKGFF